MIKSLIIGGSGTFVSRILGFIRSFLVVYLFGTGLLSDAYNVANVIPNTIYLMIIGSTFNAYFLPELVKRKKHGNNFEAYTNQLISFAIIGFVALTIISYPLAPLILKLSSTFSKASVDHLALILLYYFLPQIAFYAIYAILTQVCNAIGKFTIILWAPVLNNLLVIAGFIVLFFKKGEIAGIYNNESLIAYIGIVTTLGVVVQTLALIIVLRRNNVKYNFNFKYNLISFKELFAVASWSILFTITNQIYAMLLSKLTTAVNSQVALHYHGGIGYTSYMNSYLIIMVFHSLVIITLMNRVQPSIVLMLNNKKHLVSQLYFLEKIICIIIIPIAVYLLFFGDFVVRFLFSYHNAHDVSQAIGRILQMMSLGLIPYSLQFVYLRYFYMHKDLKTPFYINLAIACFENLSIYLAYLFPPLLWKVPMMALCFTLSYVLGALLTVFVLKRRILHSYSFKNLFVNFAKASFYSLLAGFATLIILKLIKLNLLHVVIKLQLLLNIFSSLIIFSIFVVLYYHFLYIPVRHVYKLLNNIIVNDGQK